MAVAFAVLGGGAVASIGMLAGMWLLLVELSWPHREPAGNPAWGINFDCDYAEYLLLEEPGGLYAPDDRPGRAEWCAETLGTLLSGLDVHHVRISVQWSQVEPREGAYDFGLIDALLAEADRQGAKVLLTVGMKAQRHPEYRIPGWALEGTNLERGTIVSDDPLLRSRALRMVEAVARHISASPAIEAWGAENEPFVPSKRANWWELGRDYVQEEARILREVDPLSRRVVINQGQHFVFDRFEERWRAALEDADVLAVSLYPQRNFSVLGVDIVVPIVELGPFAPNYAYQAREAHEAGREYWITEMQAEPWIDGDPRLVGPRNASANLTEGKFRKNIEYAQKTGASRVYLWGAEWWLFQREHYGDSWWWDLARETIRTTPAE